MPDLVGITTAIRASEGVSGFKKATLDKILSKALESLKQVGIFRIRGSTHAYLLISPALPDAVRVTLEDSTLITLSKESVEEDMMEIKLKKK